MYNYYQKIQISILKKEVKKTCQITNKIIKKNPKNILIINFIYEIFIKIIKYNTLKKYFIDQESIYFIKAKKFYNIKSCIKIIKYIKAADQEIKILNNKNINTNYTIKELIYKIITHQNEK